MSSTESTLIGLVNKLPDLWRQRSDSLAEFSSITRNEYITLVEESLSSQDYLPGLLEHLSTLLGCNMIASVALLTGVPEVDILGTLDKVSTKRDPMGNALKSGSFLTKMIGGESTKSVGLPAYDRLAQAIGEASMSRRDRFNSRFGSHSLNKENKDALRAQHNKDERAGKFDQNAQATPEPAPAQQSTPKEPVNAKSGKQNSQDNSGKPQQQNQQQPQQQNAKPSKVEGKRGSVGMSFGKGTIDTLTEASDLSTGKQFEIVFERNGNRAPILMDLRLAVSIASTDEIKNLLTITNHADTWDERKLKVKAGQLKFWRDLIFCIDRLEEARKARFKDKTGYYSKMMDRRSSNWLSGLLSFDMSINNASAVMVIDEDTCSELTAELGGDISEPLVRQQVFNDTLTVYIAVVNTRYGRVTIYTRGQEESNNLPLSTFKGSGGSKAGNVDDIIRAYTSGATPQLR